MDIRQLELFLAVMEFRSMTRAAERFHVSPGAVSLRMRTLAEELRADLFTKDGHHLLPTPAATRLAVMARDLIRQLHEIKNEFENDPAADGRPFHLASGATTLIHRLGAPLRALRNRYPKVEFRVTVSATEEMVAGLHERRFDLVLISLPFPTDSLEIFPLFDEELFVIRPSPVNVPQWHVGNISPAELAGATFILYPRRSNMRTMINAFFDQIGLAPKVTMEADDTEVIKRLVESGLGYSILPEYALRTRPGLFQAFRVPGHPLVRGQALAMARSEHPRALTLAIAKELQAALAVTSLTAQCAQSGAAGS